MTEVKQPKKRKREPRYRDFTCLIYMTEDYIKEHYPDCDYDGSSGWGQCDQETLDFLNMTHCEIFISPLHDHDVNKDGSRKKPHFHVVIMYDSPREVKTAISLFDDIGGVWYEKEIIVSTRRGICRYLCHLDNPEKYQYNVDDVICFGGADYKEAIERQSDKYIVIDEIIDYIDEYEIEDILLLYQMARNTESQYFEWLKVIQDNIYLFDKFCSANYKRRVFGKYAPERVAKVQIVSSS